MKYAVNTRLRKVACAILLLSSTSLHAQAGEMALPVKDTGLSDASLPGAWVKLSSEFRHHDFGFDIHQNGDRYAIDNTFSLGYEMELGYFFSREWQFMLQHSSHDDDSAEGIIEVAGIRLQAPITYKYRRSAIGVQYQYSLTDAWQLSSRLYYQKVEQGAGNFYIETASAFFGLNYIDESKGWSPELALSYSLGPVQLSVVKGYDPAANIDVSNTGIKVGSSFYSGVELAWKINKHWEISSQLTHAKVTDLQASLKYTF